MQKSVDNIKAILKFNLFLYFIDTFEIQKSHKKLYDFQSKPTVINYLLDRLSQLGIEHIFGVPGDYAFSINDAIEDHKHIKWVGSCNELNAAYSADGYARIRGAAAVNTTFGVGELSAANGIAGAYAEYLPVFHIVGLPETELLESNLPIHHSFGDGNFSRYFNAAKEITVDQAILNADNCQHEVERVIASALFHRKPVYIGIPIDVASQEVSKKDQSPFSAGMSNPLNLKAACNAIMDKVNTADNVVVFPGFLLQRYQLVDEVLDFLKETKLPFAKMIGDKGIIREDHPSFLGLYLGSKVNPQVNEFVEKCDVALLLGTIQSDRNTGGFSFSIPEDKAIDVMPNHVRVGDKRFENVLIKDVVFELTKRIKNRNTLNIDDYRQCLAYGEPLGYRKDEKISVDYLYKKWESFLKEKDIVVQETGIINFAMHYLRLPHEAQIQGSVMWRSIGWATPAQFGISIAAQRFGNRVILITGDGAHQLTVQEISNNARYGCKPVIFVVNNAGYTVERVLGNLYDRQYNDIPQWKYSEIPRVLGCDDWITARVHTIGEISEVVERIQNEDKGAYIEIMVDRDDVPPSLAGKVKQQKEENAKHKD